MRRRTGNIQDRGTSFRIRYHDTDGIRHHESFKTRDEAERELAIRMGEFAKGMPVSSRPNTVLFGELSDDVLTDYEVNKYKSVDDAEARFRLHIIPVFGRLKASQITTAQIRHYTLARLKEGARPGTVNRELELIRHTFNFAIAGRKLIVKPHIPMLKEDNIRTGFFTREEVERLTSFLPESVASVVWFAFLTGWRLGEILQLKWGCVDFARGEVRLDPGSTKNRKGRVFTMTAELRTILLAVETAQKAVLDKMKPKVTTASSAFLAMAVFPVGSFRKTWKTACYKAGIPCVVAPVKKGGKGAVKIISCSRTFHDLRRSFAREMDTLGVRQGAIMKLGGWLTDSVFKRYNIVSEGDLRDAIETVNRARKRAKGTTGNRGTQ